MSQLTAFYNESGPDSEGRLLHDLLAWDDERLEETHDFIQWLFPLPERSRFNPDAPLLSDKDIAEFYAEPRLRDNLRRSFVRMLKFFGLELSPGGQVQEAASFAARAPEVWASPNHNWLRITRILKSLMLLGLRDEADAFFAWLEQTYLRRRYPIPTSTFEFWERAALRRTGE